MNTYARVNSFVDFIESLAQQFGHEAVLLENNFFAISCNDAQEFNAIHAAIADEVNGTISYSLRGVENYHNGSYLMVITAVKEK